MRLREEVAKLTAMAEAVDQAAVPDGNVNPEGLSRREKRLAEIGRARAMIAARAKQRYAREQAEHEAKIAAREARCRDRQAAGRACACASCGSAGCRGSGQSDGRRGADAVGRWRVRAVQCYNAQAAVAAGSLLVVAGDVVQAPNDKQQVQPMLDALAALPAELGRAETMLADTGYSATRTSMRALPRGSIR